MDINTNKNFTKETIDPRELKLEGRVLKLDFDGMTPGHFEQTYLELPEDVVFQTEKYLKIIEGFTPGALKNLILITRKKFRVYAVTETKISFFSSSAIPKEASDLIFSHTFKSGAIMVFRKRNSTLQLLSGTCIISSAFHLHPETGKLLSVEKRPLSKFSESHQKFYSPALSVPNNSKTDFYLSTFFAPSNRGVDLAAI